MGWKEMHVYYKAIAVLLMVEAETALGMRLAGAEELRVRQFLVLLFSADSLPLAGGNREDADQDSRGA